MKEGWVLKKLGEVCETGSGGTPLKAYKDYYEGGTIPWLLSGEVSQGEIFKAQNFITQKGLNNSSAKLFPPNTVLVAMYGATAGQVGILRFQACTNQAVCGILPNSKILPEFIYYCFLSKKDDLISQATGNAQPNISQIKIKETKISLPPLSEQLSIVSLLDECFASIDQAKANLTKNLSNAKELFQSELNRIFSQKGEGWVEKRFDEICVLQRGFDLPTQSRKPGLFPLVSSNGVTDNIDSWKVKAPGVVTGRSGTIGNVHFIEKDYWPLNTALYIKDFHGNDPRCIFYFLKQFDLSKYSSGTGVPTLNRNNVHGVKIYFPNSNAEQQSIVSRLDALSAETKKLENLYQQKLNNLDDLKKSILQKAFAGELKTVETETMI